MRKLHLGCGKRFFGDDWFHIDGGDFPHLNYKDVTKLEFKNNSVDLIYASHLIAYWNREEIVMVLNEWKRVMKEGAILRLATPNFDVMSVLCIDGSYLLESFLGPLYGRMSMGDKIIYHKTVYNFESLKFLLTSVGFKDIKVYDWRKTEHAHIDDCSRAYLPHMDFENGTLISLNIECSK